jgi:ATP-binding cassette subfamily C (CFTR/MRP) protein 1
MERAQRQRNAEDLYQKVLETCALTADLEMLPAGDLTEIGEKVRFVLICNINAYNM